MFVKLTFDQHADSNRVLSIEGLAVFPEVESKQSTMGPNRALRLLWRQTVVSTTAPEQFQPGESKMSQNTATSPPGVIAYPAFAHIAFSLLSCGGLRRSILQRSTKFSLCTRRRSA